MALMAATSHMLVVGKEFCHNLHHFSPLCIIK